MTELTLAKLPRADAIMWPQQMSKRDIELCWSGKWTTAAERQRYRRRARRLLKAWRKR